ncbi:MAG: bifunctional aspartate kinase/diaminopimelate decarboxylase [Proteobacteria bacterium]|nr:bifunctional aspartate kinase/diaminopimelate decarboxylase [Pseudomonadota bacterium]
MSQEINEAPFAESDALGAAQSIADSKLVVMKFGGTSVSSAEKWQRISRLLRNRLDSGLRPLVVHSAIGKVTSDLEQILTTAVSSDPAELVEALRQQHYSLAKELGLDGAVLLDDSLQEIERLVAGIRLVREVSPRIHAQVVALGELMATAMGAAYLENSGFDVYLQDVREILVAEERVDRSVMQNYVSATCSYDVDPELARQLQGKGAVIVTQGFIARNTRNETVLLGREGSDTSAAYLAAILQARRLEIWTDVPGIFTTDPRLVPSARLLIELQYDEAQELAASGSKVLHPRCLSPLRKHGIPLFVRSTEAPQIQGTTVSAVTHEAEPQVKGISTRSGVTLMSMESTSMWHEVGFLAKAFTCFAQHGISIGLVSTSETNVTVSIDDEEGLVADEAQQALISDLESFCKVRVIENCATIGLVGRKIRTFLPTLSPALSVFEEERIHLVSQAANDLNLSFVIDQEQAPRLISRLHASVIRKTGSGTTLGPSWEELFRDEPSVVEAAAPWWLTKRDQLLELAGKQLNAFVYDIDSIRAAAAGLRGLESVERILYAVKANFNPDIIRALADSGIDFDCVSPGEVKHLQTVLPDLDKMRLLYTPNFAPRDEYAWAVSESLQITLDNLYPLQAWPELFDAQKLFIRLDPGTGRGHHEHVQTAGLHSKFGIPRFEIDALIPLLKNANADVIGIHAHSGSGILDPDNWRSVAVELIKVAERFPNVEVIDLGGGLGVPEKTGDPAFDLEALDETLGAIRKAYPQYRLWLEPGRYLVAQAGVLLSRVTQTKGKGDMRYIGIGTGMNALIRPALYGAYHEIVNLSRVHDAATESVTVVGPICETGDKLGSDRLLPPSQENDVILIANAGAYGRVMSSNYNLREVPPEIAI